MPFPDILFTDFSDFIEHNFAPDITLSTVLVLLYSLLDNPELLNLHGCQQYSKVDGEHAVITTTWMAMFSRLLLGNKLRSSRYQLFCASDGVTLDDSVDYSSPAVTTLSRKLDSLVSLLGLNAFKLNGKLRHWRKPIDYQAVAPMRLICPQSYQCEALSCAPYSLSQRRAFSEVNPVTLIKGSTVDLSVYVLSGHCDRCGTDYHADHDRIKDLDDASKFKKQHLNSARYLKLGQTLWTDRTFTESVLNATYSFHGSSSAFVDYWNESFGCQAGINITRRHAWQAFVLESIRMVASDFGFDLITPSAVNIDGLAELAFAHLGQQGIIKSAESHACSECSQPQRFAADQEQQNPDNFAPVAMCVVDGIVMAPTVRVV